MSPLGGLSFPDCPLRRLSFKFFPGLVMISFVPFHRDLFTFSLRLPPGCYEFFSSRYFVGCLLLLKTVRFERWLLWCKGAIFGLSPVFLSCFYLSYPGRGFFSKCPGFFWSQVGNLLPTEGWVFLSFLILPPAGAAIFHDSSPSACRRRNVPLTMFVNSFLAATFPRVSICIFSFFFPDWVLFSFRVPQFWRACLIIFPWISRLLKRGPRFFRVFEVGIGFIPRYEAPR